MDNKTFIYALLCPDTGIPRYIGKSNNPYKRLYSHLTDGRLNHRHMWLMSLRKNGKMAVVEILDEVNLSEWSFWERFYISLYRSWGFVLLNKTEGGEGCTKLDAKTKKSFSGKNNPMYGKKRPGVGLRNRLRAGKTYEEIYGEEKSIELKERLRKAITGREISEKTRAKVSKSLTGRKCSDSHRLNMSLNHYSKKKTVTSDGN